jgi:hypothetical protein
MEEHEKKDRTANTLPFFSFHFSSILFYVIVACLFFFRESIFVVKVVSIIQRSRKESRRGKVY